MAATDKTRVPKPSAIKENEQGQLVAKKGISREVIVGAVQDQGRARLDAREADQVARDLRAQARSRPGAWTSPIWTSTELVLYSPPEAGRYDSWDDVPARAEGDLREARHPPGRARAPRRRRGRLAPGALLRGPQEGVRRPGNHLLRHGHGGHRARGPRARVLHEQVRAAAGQQVLGAARRRLVGRLVPLRAQGRQGRPPAPGLLPHGGLGRGHLRAHADHRRRGLRGELHRGLHSADLLDELDALRGGRDLRQGGRQGALHDRAELVQGRVQPEHQARDRRGARHGRMGRRLHGRQEGDALPRARS